MSQTAFTRALDRSAMDQVKRAPLPGTVAVAMDAVTVTIPSGSPVACDAYIDRTRQESGDQTQASYPYVQITLQRADVDAAPRGTLIDVVDTGESFVVDKVLPGDESMLVCVVSVAPEGDDP